MSAIRYWYLENMICVFCPGRIRQARTKFPTQTFQKGDIILCHEADKILFIAEGQIKIAAQNGTPKPQTKAILTCGEAFGILRTEEHVPWEESAIAVEKSVIYTVTSEQLTSLVKKHNPVSRYFRRLVGLREQLMEERMPALVFKDGRQRVLEYIEEVAKREGIRSGKKIEIPGFLSQRRLACVTATSQQFISAFIHELHDQGLIAIRNRTLIIPDETRLRSITHP